MILHWFLLFGKANKSLNVPRPSHLLSLRLQRWALQLWHLCMFSILLTSGVQEIEICKRRRALWSLRRPSVHVTSLSGWSGRKKFQWLCSICCSFPPAVLPFSSSVCYICLFFWSPDSVAIGDSWSDAVILAQSNEMAVAVIKMECVV